MTPQELQTEIADIVMKLEGEDKPFLAQKIKDSWGTPLLEYSKSLFSYAPAHAMEPALVEAFVEEFDAMGLDKSTIETLLDELKRYRTIQTSAHTEVAPPPRRFCIDWMTTRGLEKKRPYMVGAFSGVPFSNKSKPGRITYNNTTINFIPKTHQDALVYTTEVLDKTFAIYEKLPDELKVHMPAPQKKEMFSNWASRVESQLLSSVLDHQTYVFDINSVVARYLIKVLPDAKHPMHKLLLTPKTTNAVLETFGSNMHFFYTPYEVDKYTKQENLYYLDGYGFKGDHQEYPHVLKDLLDGLTDKKLCPGTLLVFTALSFLNDFQCFGSFVQVEYVSRFKKLWESLDVLGKNMQKVPADSLTTCMFPKNPVFDVLDGLVNKTPVPGNEMDLLGEYYLPIWKQDLYYTNKLT